jgi:hypothetical protein
VAPDGGTSAAVGVAAVEMNPVCRRGVSDPQFGEADHALFLGKVASWCLSHPHEGRRRLSLC